MLHPAASSDRLFYFTIFILWLMLLLAACSPSQPPQTDGLRAHHNLRVTLIPEAHRLTGRDDIEVRADGRDTLVLALAENATIGQIKINGESNNTISERNRIIIGVESTVTGTACHKCGRPVIGPFCRGRETDFRHSSVFGKQVFIRTAPPWYQCTTCIGNPTTTQNASWHSQRSLA